MGARQPRAGRAAASPDSPVPRRATRADFPAVLALERACFQPYRQARPASLRRSLAQSERRGGHQSVWVIDGSRGGPLRALLVLWHHPHRVRVYDVATAPEARGQGLGSLLLRHAEELARDAGAAWVTLEADPRERGLVPWYEARGYAQVARLPSYYRDGGAALRLVKRVA